MSREPGAVHFQKNLTNRRGDMLVEAVTLHRRFPYAVLAGFFFFDKGADEDGTATRRATFLNAHDRFRLFTGRDVVEGREEQYERFYFVLLEANQFTPTYSVFLAGAPDSPVELEEIFDELLATVAGRNPDFYECVDGKLRSVR